jgi:hypothetical protein
LALPFAFAAAASDLPVLTPQDLRIAGQVLHFTSAAPTGPFQIAVVYSKDSASSHDEALAAMQAFGTGITVGSLVLHPLLLEAAALAGREDYGALLLMAGVSPGPVRAIVQQRHLPCLTIHEASVRDGTCLVAIRSAPTVSIVLNQEAAELAGVHFATAFRMMVREL